MPADSNLEASSVHSIDELRQLILRILCRHERLEPDAFPMSESLLRREGNPCGVLFCLRGPRSVLFTAVWDATRRMIFFYGSSGERFQTVKLHQAFDFQPAA
jgi:hypothetical protein